MGILASPIAVQLGGDPSSGAPCALAVFHDQRYFLDMFDRLFPESYLQSLKDPGPGYEVLQAFAKVGERISLAVARLDCANHILSAPDAAFSIVSLEFQRPTAAAGAVTIKAGTVCTTTNGGRDFAVLFDLAFGAVEVGPKQQYAIALEPAYEFNVRGPILAGSGEVVPGDIDTIKTLIEDPPFGDPTFTVFQLNDASGGAPGMLDAHGFDRGIVRGTNESIDAYRSRVRALPDTVTPGAIIRAMQKVFAPFGNAHFDFIETFSVAYQTCYDVTSTMLGLDTNLFVYDDPRPAYPPFRNRWLGIEDEAAAFIVVVPRLPVLSDYGMCYDDTAENAAQYQSPFGRRALCAYDVPANTSSAYLQGCYDGEDDRLRAVYSSTYALLQQIKAFGVFATIELQGQ